MKSSKAGNGRLKNLPCQLIPTEIGANMTDEQKEEMKTQFNSSDYEQAPNVKSILVRQKAWMPDGCVFLLSPATYSIPDDMTVVLRQERTEGGTIIIMELVKKDNPTDNA